MHMQQTTSNGIEHMNLTPKDYLQLYYFATLYVCMNEFIESTECGIILLRESRGLLRNNLEIFNFSSVKYLERSTICWLMYVLFILFQRSFRCGPKSLKSVRLSFSSSQNLTGRH